MSGSENKKGCLCGSAGYMVLSCSGACNLGKISDIFARKLCDNKVRSMNCLAVVAAGIEKSIAEFKKKDLLMLDGCPISCGKKILDKAGFIHYISGLQILAIKKVQLLLHSK